MGLFCSYRSFVSQRDDVELCREHEILDDSSCVLFNYGD